MQEERDMVRNWFKRYKAWRLERRAIAILHGLDDRRLSDVGTFRDSIELFVSDRMRADDCGKAK